ncbi:MULTISPECIES: hypothetical protein [unclassified Nonomuraea]|uniref:hypothetical protein n=1 Tax=unclassified Nonomuraea TaxID=2593643 RepID=UPI001376E535|nr:hypothetical protein [Nonomuraea sp. KC401]NBE93440.1 hypothetical protein [Nonomuraea sp. K271]
MIYATTPLTPAAREVVALTWGVTGSAERMHGGEESGLYGGPPLGVAGLDDPQLDRRLAGFHARHPLRHPLHAQGRPLPVEHDQDGLDHHHARVELFHLLRS